MSTPLLELEGTWEEVAAHAPELAGRRVRLTVLGPSPQPPKETKSFRPASGRSFLRHAGTWVGDDLQECLEAVVNSRGPVEYDTQAQMYLLDTNHCSRIIDGDSALIRRVAETAEPVVTCAIVCGELVDMAYRSDRRAENIAGVRQFLEDIGVYSADEGTAEIYGQLRADLFLKFGPKEKAKRRHFTLGQMGVGENDLWIAAIALQHGLTIVSADSDFARLQQVRLLPTENWLFP